MAEENISTSFNPNLEFLKEDTMQFLNEISQQHPKALSLASGRPDDEFFDLQNIPHYIQLYTKFISEKLKINYNQVVNNLGQYNRAKGIINELVSKYFQKDYSIKASPNNILINVGTQESIVIALLTLCNRERDVIIVENPAYVGITNYSLISGFFISPIQVGSDGISLDILEKKIDEFSKIGKQIKIVYVTPDFQNPSGISMSMKKRLGLIELANKYQFFIIEDNAYGDFCYHGKKYKTMKSLDRYNRVIYMHSFSKIIFPSIRIGAILTDYRFDNGTQLSDLMAKTKGYTTVNTPSVTQAILGGILIQNNFSLNKYNYNKINHLSKKKEILIKALKSSFQNGGLLKSISWNNPTGGFFITLKLPFKITKNELLDCVKDYGVIFTPMSFFYLGSGGENEIRIAFSNIKEKDIDLAVSKLTHYIKDRIENEKQRNSSS